MSGSEIMDTIEKVTDGRWKPSPGSVYPLLAWLQENEYAEETPTEESGIKRYILTEKGEKLLEEHVKFKERLERKLEFLAPPIFTSFLISTHPEKVGAIRESEKRFIRALFNLRRNLEGNLTEHNIEEVGQFLTKTAEAAEELCKEVGKK